MDRTAITAPVGELDADLGITTAAPRPVWFTVAVMLGLALVVFLPAALRAQFLAFDDDFFFGPNNPEFQRGFAAVLDPSQPIANAYLPVAHASLWFDWWWFGGQPFGPHLVSVLLHGLVAVVFVRLLGRLGIGWIPAHLAGALFVLHPTMAESVTWVSGRKDLLAGLFVFAALLANVRYAQVGGLWRVALAALCAALAMYSKATAVVLPFLALIVCCVSGGRRARFGVPVVLLFVVAPIAWHHQSIAATQGTLAAGSVMTRLTQVPGAFAHYLMQTVWPTRLNVLYPEVQTLERFRAMLWPALAVLGGLLVVALALASGRPTRRRIAFGLFAFLIALLPFNTAWPASSIAAADRYLHLAVPGLALVVALAATSLLGRAGIALLLVVMLPLGYLAGSRAHDFSDTETLWRSSLRADPDNAVAHFNLATELMAQKPMPLDEVKGQLEQAVRAARYPIHALRARRVLRVLALAQADYPAAAAHARAAIAAAKSQRDLELGVERRQQADALVVATLLDAFEPLQLADDQDGAAECHRAAVALVPDHPEVIAFGSLLQLRAVADELRAAPGSGPHYLAADDPRAAAADTELAAALATHPDHPGLLFAQASWDRLRGNVLAALRNYRRTQKVAPQHIEAWREAARLLRERESYDDAARYAQEGLQQRDDPELRQEWALALIGAGRLDEATLQLEAYLQARPGDVDTGKILANVLIGRAYGRLSAGSASHAEVLRIVDRALAYNPNEVKAHLVLGRVAREQRRFGDAVLHLETAHRLLPEFEDARTMLADSLRDLGMERMLAKDDFGAGDAWLRFLEVAPALTDTAGVRLQLEAMWRRHESRGVARLQAKDPSAAIAEFRRCLQIDPAQHWISWLLAQALHDQPDVDLAELEQLCRQAVAWQQVHELDSSEQVYLLAVTLGRRGQADAAQELAAAWLANAHPDARQAVVAALRAIAAG